MKIASWNINSVKARLEHVKRYLSGESPDILMIQELKGLEFPSLEFENIGYKSCAVTQKAYNGVAIISKYPIDIVRQTLDKNDKQARYLEADIKGLRIINIYAPNGNPVPSDKYDYKLKWLDCLYNHLKNLRDNDIEFVIGGDFNVIPEDKDCYNPLNWADDALFKLETRQAFRSLINLGLVDAFRALNPQPKQYTFWDYQAGAWQKNNGIRIDHFLLSPALSDGLISCKINKDPRGWKRPSDHTPIEIEVENLTSNSAKQQNK